MPATHEATEAVEQAQHQLDASAQSFWSVGQAPMGPRKIAVVRKYIEALRNFATALETYINFFDKQH